MKDETIITGNSKIVRNINRSTILNQIRINEPISRVQIARLTGLNKSTVSSIVNDLLEEGLIIEQMSADKNVGRNPIDLRLKLGKYLIGAINIDQVKTHFAVVDINGKVIDTSFLHLNPRKNPEEYLKTCLAELEKLYKKHNIEKLEGLGISVAGIVNSKELEVRYAPNLGWEDLNVGEIIKKYWPSIPILTMENDAKCSALAEMWFGNHKVNYNNFVFLSVGAGIGTGIVVNNKLLDGEYHASGEFGHIVLFEDGELCGCGNKGCWEAYASDQATLKRYFGKKKKNMSESASLQVDDLVPLAERGDKTAREALSETGYYIGLGITNIIRSIDPETIIIGGRITNAWDIIYPRISQVVEKRAFFGKKGSITILPTSLSIRPRVIGAAALAIKEIFDDYKITL
jgi:predicted NBD/HSP70 family sugar kinase